MFRPHGRSHTHSSNLRVWLCLSASPIAIAPASPMLPLLFRLCQWTLIQEAVWNGKGAEKKDHELTAPSLNAISPQEVYP